MRVTSRRALEHWVPGREGEGKQERSVFCCCWLGRSRGSPVAQLQPRPGEQCRCGGSGSANFSAERRMRLRINPANEMSGFVCVSLSPGRGDGV